MHGTMTLRIVGVGSPAGDDRLGWEAGAALEASPVIRALADRVTVTTLDRPGARLVAEMQDAHALILIDAVRSGAAPGTLHRLDGGVAMDTRGSLSSHGVGVAEALRLAATLCCLPRRWVVFGLEIARVGPAPGLSAVVRRALPTLVTAVERQISTWIAAPDDPPVLPEWMGRDN